MNKPFFPIFILELDTKLIVLVFPNLTYAMHGHLLVEKRVNMLVVLMGKAFCSLCYSQKPLSTGFANYYKLTTTITMVELTIGHEVCMVTDGNPNDVVHVLSQHFLALASKVELPYSHWFQLVRVCSHIYLLITK